MRLLSYFKTEAESLHYALEIKPHVWQAINGGAPILSGRVGTCTLRDPFLFQDQSSLFHLLTTDGWSSQSIVHTTSPNLITWTAQELIPVMAAVSGTRNSWAPECFFDYEAGAYRILWSSTVGGSIPPNNHRIWSSLTSDFHNFGESTLFFDPGYNVIDATVVATPEKDFMIFKDERGSLGLETQVRALRSCTRSRGEQNFSVPSEVISPSPVEGPICFREGGEWIVYYDFFEEGRWGASASTDFVEWREIPLSVPGGPRHGSVLEIEDTIGQRLIREFGLDGSKS